MPPETRKSPRSSKKSPRSTWTSEATNAKFVASASIEISVPLTVSFSWTACPVVLITRPSRADTEPPSTWPVTTPAKPLLPSRISAPCASSMTWVPAKCRLAKPILVTVWAGLPGVVRVAVSKKTSAVTEWPSIVSVAW